ncbi:MAG: hypothetical protein HPM95_15280 [Alphaproteobacteria bacterium]|nr:hypothetical protein [Alphaproteobacteria bacterium]
MRNDREASLKIVNDGGTFTGSLDLNDANKQAFYNIASGMTELGTSFNMGIHADSLFENSAVLTAGKWNTVHTSTITTGRFTSSDLLVVDADQDAGSTVTNDLIIVDVHGKGRRHRTWRHGRNHWSKTTTLTSGDTGSLKFFTSANGEGDRLVGCKGHEQRRHCLYAKRRVTTRCFWTTASTTKAVHRVWGAMRRIRRNTFENAMNARSRTPE